MNTKHFERAEMALRDHALTYPDTVEEFPWEHRAIKVKGKVFLFLFRDKSHFSLSVKLPDSHRAALALPFASPTSYGLGKSGWITARFEEKAKPPVEMLCEWIDESFRAIAPKRVLEKLNPPKPQESKSRPQASRSAKRPKGKPTTTKKTQSPSLTNSPPRS
jgi:predicted DNA-binding protein (MmcQ/YjbR family)